MQAGPELLQEMLHPGLAPRRAVGLEQTLLCPAQSEAMGHDVVDLAGGGNAILDQPQGLAPDSLQQSVPDMGGYLGTQGNGLHTDASQDGFGTFNGGLGHHPGGHTLDNGQQVHRIVGVGHQYLFRADRVGL